MGNEICVGVIGVGSLGRHHARNYASLPGCRLVGVYDASAERAAEIAAAHGTVACGSIGELLSRAAAVSVAVPTTAHYEVTKRCLSEGKDVLLEKPMTETLVQADELLALAERNRRVLQIGHIERFNTAVRAARPLVTQPRFMEAQRTAPYQPRGTDVSVILDLMIHDIDLALSFARAPLERFEACGAAVLSPSEDIANLRMVFADGCVANITASRVSEQRMRRFRVWDRGLYVSMDTAAQRAHVVRRRDDVAPGTPPEQRLVASDLAPEKEEPLKAELSAFLKSVADRSAPEVSGREGKAALEVALGAISQIRAAH